MSTTERVHTDPAPETAAGKGTHGAEAAQEARFGELHEKIGTRTALVAVVGLGYVGLPLLVEAGKEGFPLLGFDPDTAKIEALNRGESYIVDITDDELGAAKGARYTTDPSLLGEADVIIVAVPTPLHDGTPDLSLVRNAATLIAETLREGQLVVLESTTYPGTTEELMQPILEGSGLEAGKDFALAYSPERINPGSAWTLRTTPKIVAGVSLEETRVAEAFYRTLVDRVVTTKRPREAEMAKLLENTFRQVNIALVNELATISPALDVDLWEALDAAATKPFGYMPFWPGAGVGGHCIAIDPSYLSWKVEQRLGFGIGFIEHARSVNNRMPLYVVGRIAEVLNEHGLALKGAKILAVGVTYKAGVNDVRESPALLVVERLKSVGAELRYSDPYIPRLALGDEDLESVELTKEEIEDADCVIILTAHPGIDLGYVAEHAKAVFDATGASRHVTEKVELL